MGNNHLRGIHVFRFLVIGLIMTQVVSLIENDQELLVSVISIIAVKQLFMEI